MLLLSLLLACQKESTDKAETDDTAADAAEAPLPYITEESEPPQPSLSLDALAAATQEAMESALLYNGHAALQGYAYMLARQEAGCPNYYDAGDGNAYWYDTCTTSGGTTFTGYGFYYHIDGLTDGVNTYTGGYVTGAGSIAGEDGLSFDASGTVYEMTTLVEDPSYTYRSYESQVAGGFTWNGPGAEGTWLETEDSPDLTISAGVVLSYGDTPVNGHVTALDGGIPLSEHATAVVFSTLYAQEASLGSNCPEEPGGAISLRDADGNWYDILFDGPVEFGGTSEAALCDGCGTAFFRGELIGDVCVDVSSLLSWGDAPW